MKNMEMGWINEREGQYSGFLTLMLKNVHTILAKGYYIQKQHAVYCLFTHFEILTLQLLFVMKCHTLSATSQLPSIRHHKHLYDVITCKVQLNEINV